MNQITEAFMQAGVKVPGTMQRMWTVIKEEGPITNRGMAKRLPLIPAGTISSKLHELETRGMIYSRGTKSPTKYGKASVKEYLTDMDTYELMPKATKAFKPKAATQASPTPQTQPSAPPAPAPRAPSVDHLTIAQARELYAVLHKMFGGK